MKALSFFLFSFYDASVFFKMFPQTKFEIDQFFLTETVLKIKFQFYERPFNTRIIEDI